jgi:Holliday junction resolvase RusA-like endonuclease
MPVSTEAIRVFGLPAPQGSKDPWGGEANKRTKPWREQVAQVIGAARRDMPLLRGPVKVEVVFAFPRPKAHYRTGKHAGELRPDAPYWHIAPNDTDKLCRAIGDALTGVAWADDKQVSWWDARKIYAEQAYAEVTIVDLSGGSNDTGRATAAGPGSSTGATDHRGYH